MIKPAELARVRPGGLALSGPRLLARPRQVAALCVSGRSIYKHMAGVSAYDRTRDARSFVGGIPVVAHPPCRCWSKYLRTQAKPPDRESEMNLGRWCVHQVIRHGGVLEHPAHSFLWSDCDLPLPGDMANPFLYTVYLEQSWFGFVSPKATWVLVSGVPAIGLARWPLPFALRRSGELASLSSFGRSRTLSELADWLVGVARETWWSL